MSKTDKVIAVGGTIAAGAIDHLLNRLGAWWATRKEKKAQDDWDRFVAQSRARANAAGEAARKAEAARAKAAASAADRKK